MRRPRRDSTAGPSGARDGAGPARAGQTGAGQTGAGQTGAGQPISVRNAIAQALSGGTAFGTRKKVPPGRAERLGLSVVDPAVSTALTMSFEFLRLGDDRRIGAELEGRIDGLGARVLEFNADELAAPRGASDGGWSLFPYHVAAAELGFQLPWLAIAIRRVPSPSQPIYPGRRKYDLGTPDRRTNRNYVLYADDPVEASAVLDQSLRDWLPAALAIRIEGNPLITIEVSAGWVMTAVHANRLAVPDAVALQGKGRPGRPGPWPDALLGLLAGFRDRIPPACRSLPP
jgi:hypothetical protein